MQKAINKRRTFAIISHPDAGKTTITEKLLLCGGIIQNAGSIKSRKSNNYAKSDFLKVEQERGISVTSSVMQFCYGDCIINLIDTPGHEDFSEDTYRTLSAVDSALMVIDIAKGVEVRTKKLMEICRLRNTPIISFINKLDRNGKEIIDILDEIEDVLKIACVPITYPIGMGQDFKGVIHLAENKIYVYDNNEKNKVKTLVINKLSELTADAETILQEVELIKGITTIFNRDKFLQAKQTPVFFGSAINNFGIHNLLDSFVQYAPFPRSMPTTTRKVDANEKKFSGFVFKIQANTDLKHRDRLAFIRIVSGKYTKGMKILHVRANKVLKVTNAVTFLSADRTAATEAVAGDVIGILNHGGIFIGDSFSSGEHLKFIGIPNFAPEIFKLIVLKNPLKAKALRKGLNQLSEEGMVQVFRPIINNNQILGAVGMLQFEVTVNRLQYEYGVECDFSNINVTTMRWIQGCDADINHIKDNTNCVAIDSLGNLCYLATTKTHLDLIMERYPNLEFLDHKEH